MSDDDIEDRINNLLPYPPEDVFASFLLDLRRPISSIEAWLDILAEPDSEEQRVQAIEALHRELEVVRDGLDFARDYLTKRKAMGNSGG
jgi:hypothetical protein